MLSRGQIEKGHAKLLAAMDSVESEKLAKKVIVDYGKVSVITGTNVFAHINDLDDFMKSADSLLVENGIIVIEAPYLLHLIKNLIKKLYSQMDVLIFYM